MGERVRVRGFFRSTSAAPRPFESDGFQQIMNQMLVSPKCETEADAQPKSEFAPQRFRGTPDTDEIFVK
ncbi:MAG: hypothetical protein A3G34_16490 [Candidatus Lindowbacteria bacterium RIFCSPLOWO2_12_FULL_62_27]|nr:MAG: hypothetical protein A3G34_16490 [Candidatus Lindowbacteria bacterium RIFCSPLOWO2_12_FULL_62_27]